MTFVVTKPCFGCQHRKCLTVCPCESFHEGEQMLYINPESCIDCGACAPECPEEAIYPDSEVPEEWQAFIQLNADLAASRPIAV